MYLRGVWKSSKIVSFEFSRLNYLIGNFLLLASFDLRWPLRLSSICNFDILVLNDLKWLRRSLRSLKYNLQFSTFGLIWPQMTSEAEFNLPSFNLLGQPEWFSIDTEGVKYFSAKIQMRLIFHHCDVGTKKASKNAPKNIMTCIIVSSVYHQAVFIVVFIPLVLQMHLT